MATDDLKTNRLNQIAELDHFISSIEGDFNQILSDLDWSKDELLKESGGQNEPRKQPKPRKDNNGDLDDYFLLPSEKKLELYEKSLENSEEKHRREQSEMADLSLQSSSLDLASSSKRHGPIADINKLKRDLKRRRMKHRTTKTAPLTYTEELKELIELQMEIIEKKT